MAPRTCPWPTCAHGAAYVVVCRDVPVYASSVRRLAPSAALLATLILASPPVRATEVEDQDRTAGYVGPLTAGIGAATVGGGAAVLVAAEDKDVTIGGSVLAAFGTGGVMAGVALWMWSDLTTEEQEDKVHQGGVAFTAVGTGAALVGGTLLLSSFVSASDVDEAGRNAGFVAVGAGGAALLAGLIMYGVGGAPPAEPQSAWHLDVGPDGVSLRF